MNIASDETVGRVMSDIRNVEEAAEAILWKLEPGRAPTAAERNVLRLAGFETSNDVERELGRVEGIRGLMSRAGSKAEYDAASVAAIKAKKAFDENGPALAEKLAAIQAELNELEQARDSTQRALQQFNAARDGLREPRLLPAYVRNDYEADLRHLRETDRGKRVREIKSTLDVLDALERIDLTTKTGVENAKLYSETAAPHLIRRTTTKIPDSQNQMTKENFSVEGFAGHRDARLKKERPQLQRELNQLDDENAAEVSRVDRVREFYVDQL